MNEIEMELIELQANLASLALEAEMLKERMERNRAEVSEAMMNFDAALKRFKAVNMQEEEADE